MRTRSNFRGLVTSSYHHGNSGSDRFHGHLDPTVRAILRDEARREGREWERQTTPDDPPTLIYVALDRDAAQVKIGISVDVKRRVRELGRIRGRKLEVLATTPGTRDLERALHARFRPYRVEGYEWYRSEIVGELPGIVAA